MPGCMEDGSEVEGADTSLGAIIVTAGRGSEQTGWEDGSRPARLVWQWIMPGGCAWRVLIETFFFLGKGGGGNESADTEVRLEG